MNRHFEFVIPGTVASFVLGVAATFLVLLAFLVALAMLCWIFQRSELHHYELTPEDIADHRDNCPVCSGPTEEDQAAWAEMTRD